MMVTGWHCRLPQNAPAIPASMNDLTNVSMKGRIDPSLEATICSRLLRTTSTKRSHLSFGPGWKDGRRQDAMDASRTLSPAMAAGDED